MKINKIGKKRKNNNKKVQNKEIVISNQKNKLNENRFYLQTKISIKVKITRKKRLTKEFHEEKFLEQELQESGDMFPGAIFPRTLSFYSSWL